MTDLQAVEAIIHKEILFKQCYEYDRNGYLHIFIASYPKGKNGTLILRLSCLSVLLSTGCNLKDRNWKLHTRCTYVAAITIAVSSLATLNTLINFKTDQIVGPFKYSATRY